MNMLAKNRIHPLMAGAAVAVIVACAVASAAVMGWIPGSKAEKAEPMASASTTTSTQQPARVASSAGAQEVARCASCGVVTGVKVVEVTGKTSGGGMVAGGAAGALLGHELARGNNNSGVVTVVGGVAGAVVGNEVEKRAKTHKRYDVAVRMEDGSTRTVSYQQQPTWRNGDRVRVAEGKIQPR